MANVCSYDIVNGRGFTAEEKQRLVAASFASGLSVRAFAAQEGIGFSTLNKWRRRYGKMADGGPGFVPVALTDGREVPDKADQREEASLSEPVEETRITRIVITLSNGRRLEVRETIPPRTLKHRKRFEQVTFISCVIFFRLMSSIDMERVSHGYLSGVSHIGYLRNWGEGWPPLSVGGRP